MLQDLQISNFTAGELSPRMKGRTDYQKYYQGLDVERNMVTMPQGGATKRPGTMFVALAKDQQAAPFAVRQLPFIFSHVQAYTLELGGGYVRIYANDGQVSSGGSPVEIAVPYQTNEIWDVHITQSADTLFLACGTGGPNGTGYPLATITRSGATTWSYQTYPLLDGPYTDLNSVPQTTLALSGNQQAVTGAANNGSGAIRLTVGSTTGFASGQAVTVSLVEGTTEANGQWTVTVVDGTHLDLNNSVFQNAWTQGGKVFACATPTTITASQTAGINGGAGFQASDVGRALRINTTDGTNTGWCWFVINTVMSPTQVTATLQAATITTQAQAQGGLPTSEWQLGAFGPSLGYPYVVGFWQQRLTLFGNAAVPNAVWLSNTGAFDVFGTTNADGTVTPSNGLYWVIDTTSSNGQINAARWVITAGSAEALQLGLGTSGSEAILQAATTSAALSATNVQVYQETAYGSAANVPPLRIGKAVLFADVTGRKIREWAYYWQAFGYLAPDKTAESEHITRGPPGTPPTSWGLRWMAYQQSPHQVIWAGRNEGGLISITYDRDQQIWAPSQHVLGGQYYGGPPIVESGCVIPSPDGTYDELWLVVLRTVAGRPTRTIEVMTRFYDAMPQDQAWFLDCAIASPLTYPDATLTISGLSGTSPLPGTAALTMTPAWAGTGTFSANAPVFSGGAPDLGKMIRVNGGRAVVTGAISTTAVTAQVTTPLLSLAPAASGQWSCTAPRSSFSGLDYAVGETVRVLADGADFGEQVVPGAPTPGEIQLQFPASYVVAGFPYTPVLVSEPFEAQRAAFAAARGKAKRLVHLYLRFYETVGAIFGRRLTDPTSGQVSDIVERLPWRQPANPLNVPPPLFSGIRRLDAPGGFDREGQVIVTQDGPLPLTVLSINASVEVGDVPITAQ